MYMKKNSWHKTWWGKLLVAIVAALIPILVSYFIFGIGKGTPSVNSGIHNGADVSESIQTVGQTGGINIINTDQKLGIKLDYSYVASLDATGKPFEVVYPLIVETVISKILSPYVQVSATSTNADCSLRGVEAYKRVISIEPKFPFSYYFLASCEKIYRKSEWKADMKKSLEIFQITTQIAGHNMQHDQALDDIHNRFGL